MLYYPVVTKLVTTVTDCTVPSTIVLGGFCEKIGHISLARKTNCFFRSSSSILSKFAKLDDYELDVSKFTFNLGNSKLELAS